MRTTIKEKILVFIPMYNCEKQIPRVLNQFDKNTQHYFHEILIVDNQSQDQSLPIAQQHAERLPNIKVTIMRNRDNYNLGGSHKVAFNYALAGHYDYMVTLHGDDQGNVCDLVPHIESGEALRYDQFLGSRFAKGAKLIGYSRFRIFGNRVVNSLCSIAARQWITDMGSGLNMYKISYLQNKFYLYFPNNLTFNVYMLFYGIYVRSDFTFFPLSWREDDQVSNARLLKQTMIILKLLAQYVFFANRLFAQKENQYSATDYQSQTVYQHKAQ